MKKNLWHKWKMPLMVSSIDWAQLREHKDRSTEASILKRREKDEKSNRIFRSCEIVTKCAVCIVKTQEERNRRNVWTYKADRNFNFLPKLMTSNKPQIQEADRSQNMVKVKKKRKETTPKGKHIIFQL